MVRTVASRDLTYAGLLSAFKQKKFDPLYLCFGEEPYLILELQKALIDTAVAPHERDFNLDVLDGTEVEAQAVLAACSGYPMMAERRVVVITNFEQLKGNELFAAYAKNPNPTCVAFLRCNARPNLTTNPYKAIKTIWGAFDSNKLKDRQLPAWITRETERLGYTITPEASLFLSESIGNSLGKLALELEKLTTWTGERRRIEKDDIVAVSGQSREHNIFVLQSAVGLKTYKQALETAERLLQHSANRRGDALMMVSFLNGYFLKLWKLSHCRAEKMPDKEAARQAGVPPYFIGEYVNALRKYRPDGLARAFSALIAADYELKGGSTRDERLVVDLMLRKMIIH